MLSVERGAGSFLQGKVSHLFKLSGFLQSEEGKASATSPHNLDI